MRGLSPGALHRTAAQASPPATHILASSLAASTSSSTSSCSSRPPLRSIAGSAFIRPTARSIGLQSQGPGQAGRLVQTSSSTQATPDPGSRTDLGAVACASKPTEIFSSPCADIHHEQQKERRQHLPASLVCAFLHCVLLPVAYEYRGDSLDSCMSPSS
ncbi:uncharacterized protein Triagg1_1072 [Trichoderma aggressivum f. europaeum]|uniref:Uncharacterized protein n=1 Tax=Trichoderma aggressivum f. europaeum TaxID=173218 RepID=A0AAE1M9P8_9HYPO|nr:hypothetical protein Triagg1_1072 [Trichoderma aggressivum f. europaeum]